MAALYVDSDSEDYIVLRRCTRLDIGESDASFIAELAFPAGTDGNNSRADEHRNEDCAENEVVRHNGGPFGGAVLGCLLRARRE